MRSACPAMLWASDVGTAELAIDDQLRVVAGGEYALADARLAHEALRSRGTTGKLVLNPQL